MANKKKDDKKKDDAKDKGGGKSSEKKVDPSDVFDEVNKLYGPGTVMRLGDDFHHEWESISTGSVGLDAATGIGGFPRGRIVEVVGVEASGKTTICLQTIANAQKLGLDCLFVDVEHALDVNYAAKLGVDVPSLIVTQPSSGEQALGIVDHFARSGVVGVIVVDSVAALAPQAELDGDMGDAHVGLQARLMSQAMRKLTAVTSLMDVLLVFTNQYRTKIGVTWGSPNVAAGGNALRYYASLRVEVARIGSVGPTDAKIGNRTRAKVLKNKCSPPFRECEFDILYGRGVSRSAEILELAVAAGVVEVNGAWISMGGERLGQGRDRVVEKLSAEPELLAKVEAAWKDATR